MSEHFDPSEQETKELLPTNDTPESAYVGDTNADPEGVKARSVKASIVMPDFFHVNYRLDDYGNPTFKDDVVAKIMAIFDQKIGTKPVFSEKEGYAPVDEQVTQFEESVNNIVVGIQELTIVDPQSTGLSFLQLCTRTWAEFASISYDYQTAMAKAGDEIPDWLVEREIKMFDLGRKARMMSMALESLDHSFGLKEVSIQRARVQSAVEQRLQRLAEWNFKQYADTSGKTSQKLNGETKKHMQTMFDNA
tara:strand:- start:1590 stop:2336 length:747 start_codon:yes stop_codon:yes gene_type:complete